MEKFYIQRRMRGHEENPVLDLKVHPNPDSNTIVINYPGSNGRIDGFNGKYLKLANFIAEKGIGAAVQMANPHLVDPIFYPSFIQVNLRDAIKQVIDNSKNICNTTNPKIYLVGTSAGGSAAAAVAHEYPQIEKMLLFAPSGDAGSACFDGIQKYKGELYLVHGKDDEIIPYETSEKYIELAENAKKRELRLIPECDHNFKGEKNGRIFSKAHLWAFLGDDTFPSPEGGIKLYDDPWNKS